MGEGWLLTAEMCDLIECGTPNIVCAQPFACLPNHVVGKSVIKRLRQMHPESNIVAVDYDPGASEVNQLNRIKLMISVAKENFRQNREGGPASPAAPRQQRPWTPTRAATARAARRSTSRPAPRPGRTTASPCPTPSASASRRSARRPRHRRS